MHFCSFRVSSPTSVQQTEADCEKVFQQGPRALVRHCQLIIVGEPDAGKTSFLRAIAGLKLREGLPSTEGIDVSITVSCLLASDQGSEPTPLLRPVKKESVISQTLASSIRTLMEQGGDLPGSETNNKTDSSEADSAKPAAEKSEGHPTPTGHDVSSSATRVVGQDIDASDFGAEDIPTIVSVPTSRGEDTAPYSVSSDEKLSGILNDSAFQDKLPAELVQQICRELDNLDIDQQKMFVRCIDCGGQLAYSTTQSVCFGGQDSLYVVAFDVSSEGGLRSKKDAEFREGEERHAVNYLPLTHMEYILHWLSAIAMATTFPDTTRNNDQKPYVLLVGTHADKVEKKTLQEVQTSLNEPIITELRSRLRIAGPVFTDNRPAGSGESFDRGKQMGTLQMKLQAEIDRVEAQHVPPAALKLEMLIRNPELQQHWKFVDRARFSRLYSVCGGGEDSFEETLVYLRKAGSILFFGDEGPHPFSTLSGSSRRLCRLTRMQ